MKIGKPIEAYIVEPLEDPVPRKGEAEEDRSEREPVRISAEEEQIPGR